MDPSTGQEDPAPQEPATTPHPATTNVWDRPPPPPLVGHWYPGLRRYYIRIFREMESRELFDHFLYPLFYTPTRGYGESDSDSEDGDGFSDEYSWGREDDDDDENTPTRPGTPALFSSSPTIDNDNDSLGTSGSDRDVEKAEDDEDNLALHAGSWRRLANLGRLLDRLSFFPLTKVLLVIGSTFYLAGRLVLGGGGGNDGNDDNDANDNHHLGRWQRLMHMGRSVGLAIGLVLDFLSHFPFTIGLLVLAGAWFLFDRLLFHCQDLTPGQEAALCLAALVVVVAYDVWHRGNEYLRQRQDRVYVQQCLQRATQQQADAQAAQAAYQAAYEAAYQERLAVRIQERHQQRAMEQVARAKRAFEKAVRLSQCREEVVYARRRCIRTRYWRQKQTAADRPYAVAYNKSLQYEVRHRLTELGENLDEDTLEDVLEQMRPYVYDEDAERYGDHYYEEEEEEQEEDKKGDDDEYVERVPPLPPPPAPTFSMSRLRKRMRPEKRIARAPTPRPERGDAVDDLGPPPDYHPPLRLLGPDIVRSYQTVDHFMSLFRSPLRDRASLPEDFDPAPDFPGEPDDVTVPPPAYFRVLEESHIRAGPLHCALRREIEAQRIPNPWRASLYAVQLRFGRIQQSFANEADAEYIADANDALRIYGD